MFMKEKTAKWIGIITVAPIMALLSISLVYHSLKNRGADIFQYLYLIIFLVLIPILSYPIQKAIPALREGGRAFQRKLAFVFSLCSYVISVLGTFFFQAKSFVMTFSLAYLFSGLLLSLLNGVLKFKASGHACGLSGPMTLLVHFLGPQALWMVFLLPVVFWARLLLRRHRMRELWTGTAVGILGALLAILC